MRLLRDDIKTVIKRYARVLPRDIESEAQKLIPTNIRRIRPVCL